MTSCESTFGGSSAERRFGDPSPESPPCVSDSESSSSDCLSLGKLLAGLEAIVSLLAAGSFRVSGLILSLIWRIARRWSLAIEGLKQRKDNFFGVGRFPCAESSLSGL